MTEFIEIKTAELTGAALDWAVAKAEGVEISLSGAHPHAVVDGRLVGYYAPSSKWNQGGPLIEKYKLDIGAPLENKNGPWNAATEWAHPMGYKGDTPLIAACRAIVASVLGDTVSVPKELLS